MVIFAFTFTYLCFENFTVQLDHNSSRFIANVSYIDECIQSQQPITLIQAQLQVSGMNFSLNCKQPRLLFSHVSIKCDCEYADSQHTQQICDSFMKNVNQSISQINDSDLQNNLLVSQIELFNYSIQLSVYQEIQNIDSSIQTNYIYDQILQLNYLSGSKLNFMYAFIAVLIIILIGVFICLCKSKFHSKCNQKYINQNVVEVHPFKTPAGSLQMQKERDELEVFQW
ncbi:Hypothetical_protein [Hexamita inflata]|uniref:Hypothetical_protein n=1 Tax=Hexamita inflata TaxID=28002 RepID=A0ABP1HZC9_9EUKA